MHVVIDGAGCVWALEETEVFLQFLRSGVYLWSVAVRSDCDGGDSGGQRLCVYSRNPAVKRCLHGSVAIAAPLDSRRGVYGASKEVIFQQEHTEVML